MNLISIFKRIHDSQLTRNLIKSHYQDQLDHLIKVSFDIDSNKSKYL